MCERAGLEGVVGGREGVRGCGWRKRGVQGGEVGGREGV